MCEEITNVDCFLSNSIETNKFSIDNKQVHNLSELMSFMEVHWDQVIDLENMNTWRKYIHHYTIEEIKNTNGTNISFHIEQFLMKTNSLEIDIALQVIYQVLKSLETHKTENNLLRKLIDENAIVSLIECLFKKNILQTPALLSKSIVCIQLYMKLFPESIETLSKKVWYKVTSGPHQPDLLWPIIVEFADSLIKCAKVLEDKYFMEILEKFVDSEIKEARKAGFYMINLILEEHEGTLLVSNRIKKGEWMNILVVLENLESNQSHLMIPSLELFERLHSQYFTSHTQLLAKWYNIIFRKLFKISNIFVQRWFMQFVVNNLTWDYLKEKGMSQNFLEILNNNKLYSGFISNKTDAKDFDSEAFDQKMLQKFLEPCFCNSGAFDNFIKQFAEINWKPIPFTFWLKIIQHFRPTEVNLPMSTLLTISNCARQLTNISIRKYCLTILSEMFQDALKDLSFANICLYIENSCNNQVDFINEFCHILDYNMKHHIAKKQKLSKDDFYFSKRFSDIVNVKEILKVSDAVFYEFLSLLSKENFGYLIFNLLYCSIEVATSTNSIQALLKKIFSFDLQNLLLTKNFVLFKEEVLNLTKIFDYMNVNYINEQANNLFILQNIRKYSDFRELQWEPMDFLHAINDTLMQRLIEVTLSMLNSDFSDETLKVFLNKIQLNSFELVQFLNNKMAAVNVDLPTLSLHVFSKNLQFFNPRKAALIEMKVSDKSCIDLEFFLNSLVLIDDQYYGEKKTEFEYIYHQCLYETSSYFNDILSQDMFQYIFAFYPKDNYERLSQSIIDKFKQLNKSKPRYFNDSLDHVLYTRLINFIFYLEEKNQFVWHDDLWNLTLLQNHQPNITICLEYLIAKMLPDSSNLDNKILSINQYTSSQQVSILSIKFLNFAIKHRDTKPSSDSSRSIIYQFLPFTMGSSFQVRLYAQLFIYFLIQNFVSEQQQSQYEAISAAIRAATNNKLDTLLNDIRLIIAKCSTKDCISHIIHFCTKAPINEYSLVRIKNLSDFQKLNESKILFEAKPSNIAKGAAERLTNKTLDLENDMEKCNLQRKNLCIKDIQLHHNMAFYLPVETANLKNSNHDMNDVYVVATLVDKHANLGGITRTCEVLGIKNLIINSKEIVNSVEFKALSLTAEKHLNIIEIKADGLKNFLLDKQMENYKIVGAEQVSNSQSLCGFQFPRKVVIVLGNEKKGINADLLSLLDYTIEIPQFGSVRSLNVHVTAALFLWEYCKQYMVNEVV